MLYYLKITIDESKILINFKKKGSEIMVCILVFETTNVSSLLKKNFSSNFSLEEYGENLKIVKSKTQRILRNLNN